MSKKSKFNIPTAAEDALIRAGIDADPDAREIPSLEGAKRGRPKLANPKKAVSLRVDEEVVTAFKKTGVGWQSRMNLALRASVGLEVSVQGKYELKSLGSHVAPTKKSHELKAPRSSTGRFVSQKDAASKSTGGKKRA